MTRATFRADNTEGYTAVQLDLLNDEFAIACAELDIDPLDDDNKSSVDAISECLLRLLDTADAVGERWWVLGAYNTPAIYAWGTETEVDTYADRLNARKEVNVYHAEEMSLGKAAALELTPRIDDGVNLRDELAEAVQ